MLILQEEERRQLEGMLQDLERPVELLVFTQEMENEHCSLGRLIAKELADCSPRVRLTVKDFVRDASLARRFGVNRIPATVVLGENGKDYGVRFFGPAMGYQLAVLAQDVVRASRGDDDLPRSVRDKLATLSQPMHLQVMVTATCPYCASMVLAAHRFAMASEHIAADMVDVAVFPHLAVRYQVQEVPCTIVNDGHQLGGLMAEGQLAETLVRLQDVQAQDKDAWVQEESDAAAG